MTLPVLALSFAALASTAALAQNQLPPPPGQLAPGAPDRLLRGPYITSTGATVARPGESQSGGPTKLDREIQHQDNAIDKSICKGC